MWLLLFLNEYFSVKKYIFSFQNDESILFACGYMSWTHVTCSCCQPTTAVSALSLKKVLLKWLKTKRPYLQWSSATGCPTARVRNSIGLNSAKCAGKIFIINIRYHMWYDKYNIMTLGRSLWLGRYYLLCMYHVV